MSKRVLVPAQIATPLNLKKSLNYHEQWMLKHAESASQFHSRSELYFAALLEGDPTVQRYVPQPFAVPLPAGKSYVPDFYVQRVTGREVVYEVTTPRRAKQRPVRAAERYLGAFGMQYRLVETPTIFQRELEAENWLMIVRRLVQLKDADLHQETEQLDHLLAQAGPAPIEFLIQHLSAIPVQLALIAVFRLLHSGTAHATLLERPISMQTEVELT